VRQTADEWAKDSDENLGLPLERATSGSCSTPPV